MPEQLCAGGASGLQPQSVENHVEMMDTDAFVMLGTLNCQKYVKRSKEQRDSVVDTCGGDSQTMWRDPLFSAPLSLLVSSVLLVSAEDHSAVYGCF